MVQQVKNPTSIHEDAALIPSLAQWVKDLALPPTVAQVADVALLPHCCGCGVGLSCNSDSTPSLGPSICCRCGPKKKKKNDPRLFFLIQEVAVEKYQSVLGAGVSWWYSRLRIRWCHCCGSGPVAWVTAVAQVQSLAWELLPATGAAKKKKKKKPPGEEEYKLQ